MIKNLFQYAAVGLIATATHYLLTFSLAATGAISDAGAGMLGAALGAVVAFELNRSWTFASSKRASIIKFLLVALLLTAVNGAVIQFCSQVLAAPLYLSQPLATLIALPLGYFINRYWSFA